MPPDEHTTLTLERTFDATKEDLLLDPYDRIVTGEPDKSFLLEVEFIAKDSRTTMRVKITGLPPEYREPATEGWNVCFDQLAQIVEA